MENYGPSATIKHKDLNTEIHIAGIHVMGVGVVCLCTPALCFVYLYMYLCIYI